ncbi:MAG: hypothetical protein ACE3JR_03805 [Ectobacillus sp.]
MNNRKECKKQHAKKCYSCWDPHLGEKCEPCHKHSKKKRCWNCKSPYLGGVNWLQLKEMKRRKYGS